MNNAGDIVRKHLRNGDIGLARIAAEEMLKTAPESDHGVLYALLARAWYRLGNPKKAMAAAEEASQRTDHWEAALALGKAMVAAGEPMGGRAVLSEAMRKVQAQDHDDPSEDTLEAEMLVGTALAEACRAAGDPQTGIGVATRALAFAERYEGADSPDAANAWFALGTCLHGNAQHNEAHDAFERALRIREAWRPESPDVAATLDALGAVERKRGKPFKAVARHRRALEIWEKQLGEHASLVGACRHSLAQALHRTGDFVAAREEMARAFLITSRTLGTDHVDTWITRFELGRFQVDVGEMEEGFQTMEEARTKVRERLGRFHPVVAAMDRFL